MLLASAVPGFHPAEALALRPQGRFFRHTPHVQFSAYLFSQNPFHMGTVAPHVCSRRIAEWFVQRGIARKVGQNAIQLSRDITWKQAKDLVPGRRNPLDWGLTQDSGYDHPWSWQPQA